MYFIFVDVSIFSCEQSSVELGEGDDSQILTCCLKMPKRSGVGSLPVGTVGTGIQQERVVFGSRRNPPN